MKYIIKVEKCGYRRIMTSYWNSEQQKLCTLSLATKYDSEEEANNATCELQSIEGLFKINVKEYNQKEHLICNTI